MALEEIVRYMHDRPFVGNTVRIDVNALKPEGLAAAVEWIKSLGFDPSELRGVIALVHRDSGWELRLSRIIRNENGTDIFDVAHQDLVSEPVVVQLGESPELPDLGDEGFIAS